MVEHSMARQSKLCKVECVFCKISSSLVERTHYLICRFADMLHDYIFVIFILYHADDINYYTYVRWTPDFTGCETLTSDENSQHSRFLQTYIFSKDDHYEADFQMSSKPTWQYPKVMSP